MKQLFLRHNGELIKIDKLTSDTHIGHKNIAKYTGRPYDNTEGTSHMDQDLLRLWNEAVDPDDNVLHLGDAALGDLNKSVPLYGRANGTKFLKPGNHDYFSEIYSQSRRERWTPIYEEFFILLPETPSELVAIKDGEERLLHASHYPTYEDDRREGKPDRFERFRPSGELPIVHGHTHYKESVSLDRPREFHAGVEAHNLAPIDASVVVDWVFSLE